MREKRSFPRVGVSHPVYYHTESYPVAQVASSFDLSLGGVGIETSCSLILGESLDVSLAIPPKLIKAKGKVVHSLGLMGEKLKAGIQFLDLPKHESLYLGAYITNVLKHQQKTNPLLGLLIAIGFSMIAWILIIYVILQLI